MKNRLLEIAKAMQQRSVLVIGDLVADVYVDGRIARISREAPVLILEYAGETIVPGGAANAIHNMATLGGIVYAVGVIGDDRSGEKLTAVLKSKGVNTNGIVIDANRPTITKTRIMAGGQATVRQQVVRIDRESKDALAPEAEQALLRYILDNLPHVSAVVFSDYGAGTVSPRLISTVLAACRDQGITTVVDSRYNILSYKGVSVVKQNESEAAAALGVKQLNEHTLDEAGQKLLQLLQAEAVLITQGPAGMTLYEKTGKVSHIPVTNKSDVYDVTGAGDTVVAAMVLALAAGASYVEAAQLANIAAGIVVRKPGTATTTPEELKQAIVEHYDTPQLLSPFVERTGGQI